MKLVVGENSYMTVDEANEIVEDNFFEDDTEYVTWKGLSENDKTKVIYNGTKLIETLPFIGVQYPGYQNMKWPRLISLRYVECPYDVKVAILNQGLKDKENYNKQETKLQELGVKTYSIKGASISFGDSLSGGQKLSNGVYSTVFDTYLSKWVH